MTEKVFNGKLMELRGRTLVETGGQGRTSVQVRADEKLAEALMASQECQEPLRQERKKPGYPNPKATMPTPTAKATTPTPTTKARSSPTTPPRTTSPGRSSMQSVPVKAEKNEKAKEMPMSPPPESVLTINDSDEEAEVVG